MARIHHVPAQVVVDLSAMTEELGAECLLLMELQHASKPLKTPP